ncbi:hypothetical protein [Companilactobacillus mishanensis]|uniref:Uncharacterized protein n=1 Tax=Companilactobacillus mishanensis TaxID=2486008 RepID=A0A5P0ZJQ5_9LACO|nr:hypothetical protein [Companilactobacillus mishanensis]MQS53319.1 hypothetical protein [Companilactobacillus mishanensis]
MNVFDKISNHHAKVKENKQTAKEIKKQLKTNKAKKYGFCWFDDIDNVFYKEKSPLDSTAKKYAYSEIMSYEPVITGSSKTKHHGITRAVAGGLIAGGAGAVVGAITGGKNYDVYDNIEIVVQTSDYSRYHISLLSTSMKADSFAVKAILDKLEQLSIKLDRIIAANIDNGSIHQDKIGFDQPQPDISNHSGIK